MKVIWSSLVEEPTMFLRTFLEKLTNRDRREELIYMLRKMLYHLPELPAQTAHTLFNYLVRDDHLDFCGGKKWGGGGENIHFFEEKIAPF